MSDNKRPPRDMLAWGLLLSGLLVAGCLLSHDPTQAAGQGRFPPTSVQSNLLGAPGGWFATQLFAALGNATYFLLAGWFAITLTFFTRTTRTTRILRALGWCILLPCAALAAELVFILSSTGSLYHGGGSLGAWLRLWLVESYSSLSIQVVLVASCFLLGAMLAFDTALAAAYRIAKRVFAGIYKRVRLIPIRRTKKTINADKPKRKKKSIKEKPPAIVQEVDEPDVDETPADVGTIPIRHPAVNQKGEQEQDQDQDQNKRGAAFPIHRPVLISDVEEDNDYQLPSLSLLDDPEPFPYEEHDQILREKAALLEKTFSDFDLNVRVVGINTGPVITQFEITLETGLRVNKVTRLADDIALNLKVVSVRMVAPIPGKNTVGVEIPNENRAIVRIKEVVLTSTKQIAGMRIPLFLGKDTEGRPLTYDLAEMPHLLIAGRTGTGKSVCLNSIILSILMTRRPDEVKMLMIDPKRTELSEYGQLPHLMHPVVTDANKAEAILSWAVDEMERRYDILSQARVRNISSYNRLSYEEKLRRINPPDEEADQIVDNMPNIVIIVDEMADLMIQKKREVEGHIIRLAQKSRAAGIHLVVATQKPTVDVITGLIKSNLPARICFQVASRSDSRVVLDEMGAEKLLGKGDMLFLQPGTSMLIRSQGTYASDEELTRVVEEVEGEPEFAEELLQLGSPGTGGSGSLADKLKSRDEVYEQAIEVVIREGRGSVSLLQRALGIGYGRAARIIDFMAEDGFVGAYRGSSAREVLVTPEEWEMMKESGEILEKV